MRNHVNQIAYPDGASEEKVIPWTLEDYEAAISSNSAEKENLITERAVLLGAGAMTVRIDQVADAKRLELLGDATRFIEYQAADEDAKAYAAAGFEGPVPDNVMSWATAAGLTPKQAAENIMYEARLFIYARNVIRLFRLEGKQAVRSATTPEQAIEAYMTAIAKISSISPI